MPWGDEAFAAARERDCAVLVSIGYSACHWCHVMERESFEDPEVAALMNELLRLRQGRPRGTPGRRRDLHGRGAGDDRAGRLAAERVHHPGRRAVLHRHLLPAAAAPGADVVDAGAARRSPTPTSPSATRSTAEWSRCSQRLRGVDRHSTAAPATCPTTSASRRSHGCASSTTPSTAASAARRSSRSASAIEFLLGQDERAMSVHTLRAMANGGIYDQIGGGFARYSVDARWLVPHFEKMLYDNALLARAYLHGWQRTGRRAAAAGVRGDARLHVARAAPAGGRLRLGAGRGLRGRRGQVLRVAARRGARGGGARLRHDRGRQLGGRQHPGSRHERPAGPGGARRPSCWPCASSGCGPGSTTSA